MGVRESEGMETAGHLTQDTWGLSEMRTQRARRGMQESGGRPGAARPEAEGEEEPGRQAQVWVLPGWGRAEGRHQCAALGPWPFSSLVVSLPGHTFFPQATGQCPCRQDLEAARAPGVGMGTLGVTRSGVQR